MNPMLKSMRAACRTRRKATKPCLAELIAWYMEKRGWSSADFAKEAGVNPSIISKVLNFKQLMIFPETVAKIAKVLRCDEAKVWSAQRVSRHLAHGNGRNDGDRWNPRPCDN